MLDLGRQLWVVVTAAAIVASACGSSPSPTGETDGFPAEVLGMPVLGIAVAQTLIDSGSVDGRALAVGGWWVQAMASGCPMPMRSMALLEAYCVNNIFASQGFTSSTCTQFGDRTECHTNPAPIGAAVMAPIIVNETSGWEAMLGSASGPVWRDSGVPAVLIGHARDPRIWHCPEDTRQECARKFVVDRVMWLGGDPLDLGPSDRGFDTTLSPDQASAAVGDATLPIAALPMHASQMPEDDPRIHLVGNQIVWLVRTLRSAEGTSPEDPTRLVDVSVVDDATGTVQSSIGLEMPAATPALLSVQATEASECCNSSVVLFYRVEAANATGLQEGVIGGSSASGVNNTITRHGAGSPVLLSAGHYVVRVWRSEVDRDGNSGNAHDECSTEVNIGLSDELRLEAEFPDSGPCVFVNPTFENPFGF